MPAEGQAQRGPRGWHSRGYLPHFDAGEVPQSVTIRLADSLPADVLEGWRDELQTVPDHERDERLDRRLSAYLDAGHGACWLRRPQVADLMQAALLHHDATRYQLLAWVIMPNHVHAVLLPLPGVALGDVLHSLKSFTAHAANRLLGREGRFWQADYFDRFIRSEQHLRQVMAYVESNPVVAGLCQDPADWRWGSAAAGGRDARAP